MGSAQTENSAGKAVPRIGISLPLTGPASTYGIDFQNGFLFANRVLANDRYQLIFEDDHCDPKAGVSVAHKFATVDKIRFVLGVSCDGVFSAAAPVYQQQRVVVVSTSASYVPGDHLFHANLENKSWPKFLLEYLQGRVTRMGVLTEQTTFAQTFGDAFINLSRDYSVETVGESFLSDAEDLTPILLKLRNKNVSSLLLVTQTETSLIRIVQQLQKIGLDLPLYNIFFAGSPTFLSAFGDRVNGLIYLDFPSLSDSLLPASREVYAKYVSIYGAPQSGEVLFIQAFESFRAMDLAIQSGREPAAFLRGASFQGLESSWHFDKRGFRVGPKLVVKRVENGKGKALEWSNKAEQKTYSHVE